MRVYGDTVVNAADERRPVKWIGCRSYAGRFLAAEGAPSESFMDDDSRGMFHNGHEFGALYPDAPRPDGLQVEQGAQLAAIRRRLMPVWWRA